MPDLWLSNAKALWNGLKAAVALATLSSQSVIRQNSFQTPVLAFSDALFCFGRCSFRFHAAGGGLQHRGASVSFWLDVTAAKACVAVPQNKTLTGPDNVGDSSGETLYISFKHPPAFCLVVSMSLPMNLHSFFVGNSVFFVQHFKTYPKFSQFFFPLRNVTIPL